MAREGSGHYTPEFIAAAVKLVIDSGRPVMRVAPELGVNHQTLWRWVDNARMSRIDPEGELPVAARKRIRDLEIQNARLRRDLDFEKKAGAFFQELDRGENDSL